MSVFPAKMLSAVCDISMGQAPKGDSYNAMRSGYPLIAGAGDFGELTPAPKKYTDAPTKLSRPGDLILCIRATIGDRNWSDKEYCLGRGVAGLRAKDADLSQAYLWHWLDHVAPVLRTQGRGATFLQVSKGDIAALQIPLPPLDEQKRIAGILDAADALRAKRREALAQLDTLLQSTFLDMFGDPVTNPMGWEKPPLEDLCDKVIDCPHSTPRWSGSGVICLRTSNLGKGEWNWADTRFVIEEDYTERTRRSEILPNDIILSREGTVGVLALVDEGMRLCMGQRLVQLRVNDSQLDPRFLLNLLLHDLAPERFSRLIAGSTSKHLNVKELRKLPVLLPPLDLQHRFAAIVQSVEHQKPSQRAHQAELDTLFASLQSRAFRGDL